MHPGCICDMAANMEKRMYPLIIALGRVLCHEPADGGQNGGWVLSVPAGCYADCQGNYISGCLVSMVAPSETVAKQFWHLSNRSTVTATTKPPAEGQQEERQHKAEQQAAYAVRSHRHRRDDNCSPLQRKHGPSVNSGRSNLQRENAP